jgi:hypothetical protein
MSRNIHGAILPKHRYFESNPGSTPWIIPSHAENALRPILVRRMESFKKAPA